jgi:hypothetical protein
MLAKGEEGESVKPGRVKRGRPVPLSSLADRPETREQVERER